MSAPSATASGPHEARDPRAEGLVPDTPTRRGSRLGRFLGWLFSVLVQTFVEPVRKGRLRDTGWSPGLRAAVVVGYGAIAVGALVVLLAGPARETLALAQYNDGETLPRAMVWPLLVLTTVALTLFLMACIHGPVWLTVVGVVLAVPSIGGMALLNLTSGAIGPQLFLTAGLMLAAMTLVLVWRRGPVRRYEFAVLFVLLHLIVVMVAVQGRTTAIPLGFDLLPPMLGLQVGLLSAVALPLTFAAGTAPAEVTAILARRAAAMTSRWSTGRALRIVLIVVLVLATAQAGWALTGLDPIVQGWTVWATATVFVVAAAGLCRLLVALARRPVETDEVADTGADMAWVVGGAVVGLAAPLLALLVVVTALASTVPGLGEATAAFDQDLGVVLVRGLIAVVGLALAVRWARQGLITRAAVVGVGSLTLLPPLVARALSGEELVYPDPVIMTILITAGVVIVTALSVVRRRLTAPRAVALLTVGALLALIPHRGLLAEPLDTVLGSSAGLILLGLVWQLLTASSVGNRHGRHLALPARVLLIMSSVLITVVVLAYNALLRNPSLGGLELVLDLADQSLGVAILAGVIAGALADAAADRSPAE